MKDKNEFVNVANVHASPQLAWLLKPYNGCPRGPMDLPGLTYESSGGALALLKDAEDYLVKGPDDTFVCVPKMWFDLIVKSLEEPREGTEDQDDQEPPIIEFPFPETKTADKPRLAEVLGVEEMAESTRGQNGLILKYDVKKIETGETVNNCFVLRPDKDPAAVTALRAYARATPNKALADDIMAWVGAEPVDKPLSEWTLGDVLEFCHRDDSFCTRGEEECPFFRTVCQERVADWDLQKGIKRLPCSRLTEAEIAIMRAVGAKWVSRDEGFDDVFLWLDKPRLSDDNKGYYLSSKLGNCITSVRAKLFPSVKPGDCLCLDGGPYADAGSPGGRAQP